MPYYPSQPDKPPKNRPWNRPVFRVTVLVVSVLLIGYGAIRLISYGADLISARKTTQELRDAMSEADSTPESFTGDAAGILQPDPAQNGPATETEQAGWESGDSGELPVIEYPNGYEMNEKILQLRKKNEYIIGWLTMDDLDEPIAMKDNEFFLDHDATGKKNVNGAIFMDEDTGLLTRPYTILLYGHNMKTGAMFGNLRKYEDASYCYKHRRIRVDTLYEAGNYEIFAVATISLTPGKAKYVSLTGLQSIDRKTRKEALQSLVNAGTYKTAEDVSEEDQVVLLITCVGDDDERLVVAAKRILK